MTTLVGIKTNSGSIEAVVLGSDTQLNYLDEDGNPISKRPILKIIYGDFWALASCGAYTDELRSFYNKLRKPEDKRYKNFDKGKLESMINKTVGCRRFIQIDELNANYLRDGGDLEEANEFLMAINKPRIELFHVDPFGNLILPKKNKNYIILGTGGNDAKKYMEEQFENDVYDSDDIDLKVAMELCRKAVKNVSQKGDIMSGLPLDLIVVRKEGIKAYGKRIKNAIEQADENEFKNIMMEEIGEKIKEGI